MKKIVLFVIMAMAASTACAWPWGKKEVKDKTVDMKPAIGYVEQKETVTNTWAKAVKLYEDGKIVISGGGVITYDGGYIYTTTNSCLSFGSYDTVRFGNMYIGEVPKCDKPHLSDWPKTKTTIKGVQYKTTFTVYKDGAIKGQWVEHSYPHTKITESVTTRMKPEATTRTKIEDTSEPE